MITEFSPEVQEKLKFYVYRLVDPRNGKTFYVGKGKGNRVFDHANAVNPKKFYAENPDFKPTEDNKDPAKIDIILEIKNIGLNVINMIQRWGMTDESTAFEVEAAFIDYFGLEHLTNKQNGHDGKKGMRWADELEKEYKADLFEDYNPKDKNSPKFILIKINDYSINLSGGNIYEAVRKSWDKITPKKANAYPYVLAVKYGLVVGVYEIDKNGWKKTEDGKRAYFTGQRAPLEIESRFLGKRIPDRYKRKGCRIPTFYCDGPKF